MLVFDFVMQIFSMLPLLTVVHGHDLMGQLSILETATTLSSSSLRLDYSFLWLLASLVVSDDAFEMKKNDIQFFCRDQMEQMINFLMRHFSMLYFLNVVHDPDSWLVGLGS